MKREFLQNIKVGDQPLTKEIIDSIMEEYGKGINAVKAQYADYETMKSQNQEYAKTIETMKAASGDAEKLNQTITELQGKISTMEESHKQELAERDFRDKLDTAIRKANGKNGKAISALLDLETLKGSKNQDADITAAIEACQKENGYLFDDGGTPPPYASGTGSASAGGRSYTQEELANMSMEEYRRYRMGK